MTSADDLRADRERSVAAAASSPASTGSGRFGVWIDQDLCTGDGLCSDFAPEVFVLLDDGIAYVKDGDLVGNDPGGAASVAPVPQRLLDAVITAVEECPGECIFVQELP